ncbi:MAG TPA: serine/threonine-protein kinase [Kofleriaceae bacterium]|nr:serine/threonine-protein kinase [Kofleriaceae bacterium]
MTAAPAVREPTAITVIDPSVQPSAREPDTASTTLASSEQALVHFEAHRVRGLMIGMSITSLLTAGLVLGMGGDPFAARVHAIALAISGVLTSTYSIVFRDPARYRQSVASIVAFLTLGVALTGYYYWGVFSGYAAAVPITLYVMAQGATLRTTILGTVACVVAQSGFTLATVFGWIESRGLVEPVLARAGTTTQIIAMVLLQGLMVTAALAGRDAQRTARAVLEQHAKSLRDLAQRDAQLAEARADADQARQSAGRFTGQVVGDYQLRDVLGRGAMGEVYAAHHVETRDEVAVKLLAPHLLRSTEAHERFARECKIISSLSSPHVVRVLAISAAGAALPYIVMERLEGSDLGASIKHQPVLALPEIVELVRQIAAGLDAAHGAGVIHRDLKPSNVLGTGEPEHRLWKILDFGASKWTDGDGTLTQDQVVGTPGYMAPEQALREAVDARADIYALGVILYRVTTGIPAVVPGDAPSMLHEVAYRMPMQPSRVAEVPLQIESVLAIALAKQPADRFATAGELATALTHAAAGRLPTTLFERARRILTRTPWGTWIDRRAKRATLGYGAR